MKKFTKTAFFGGGGEGDKFVHVYVMSLALNWRRGFIDQLTGEWSSSCWGWDPHELTWQPSFSLLLAGKRGLLPEFFYAQTHLAIKLYNLLTGEQSHLSWGSRPSHSTGKLTFWQVSEAPFPEVLYPVTQLTIKLYWPSDKVVDGSTFWGPIRSTLLNGPSGFTLHRVSGADAKIQ